MKISDYVKNNRLAVIVKPNSSKNKIVKYDDSKKALRVDIKAPPESGKANLQLVKFFSKLLKKNVKIVSGAKSKKKILKFS